MCGCEMLVTQKGALPEVIGTEGESVAYGDLENLVQKVRQIIAKPDSDVMGRSQRLRDKFSPAQREKLLVKAITF
jgi:glycosyltransferase involved in cell wall biosynthesis